MKIKITGYTHDTTKGVLDIVCEIGNQPVYLQVTVADLQAQADKKAYIAGLAKTKYGNIMGKVDLLGEVEV